MNRSNSKEEDTATLYPESQITNESTLVNPSKLQKLLFNKLTESSSSFNETKTIHCDEDDEDDDITIVKDEEEEDPYRWFILLGGFLAQAVSMSTLSRVRPFIFFYI
ncbi:unnamed protein product [Cunninghamella echinulata]